MRSRAVLALGAGAALCTGVLLLRPGTAATDADLRAAPSTPATASTSAAQPLPAVADVAAEPVFGISLGDSTTELEAAGYRLGAPTAGCTPVLPGLTAPGPGAGLTAWAVRGRLASVTLTTSAGSSGVLAGLLGRDLVELAAAPGAVSRTAHVPVGWSDRPVTVGLVAVPGDGAEVLAADVLPDGTADHVELSTPAAVGCDAVLRAGTVGTTALRFDGWGPISLGMDEAALREVVTVSRPEGGVPRLDPDTGAAQTRCRTLVVQEPEGPASVLLVDGAVRSVSIDAGSTGAGLRIGDGAAAVTRAYPAITTAYVDDRWRQGLAVRWQYPQGELRVFGGPQRAPVPGLDAEVEGPGPVVVRVEAGGSC